MRSVYAVLAFVLALAGCTRDDHLPMAPAARFNVTGDSIAPLYGMQHPRRIPGEYIVRFKGRVDDVRESAKDLARAGNGTVKGVMHGLKAAWLALPDEAVEGVRRNPNVMYVEANYTITLASLDSQFVGAPWRSWALDRIDQRLRPYDSWFKHYYDGSGVHIWITDTGVNQNDPEISPRISTTFAGADDLTDCNGHGTRVAIMAAGVHLGVAKNATIHPEKITIGCSDTANVADAEVTIDYIALWSPRPAIINVSLSGPCGFWGCGQSYDDQLRDAISRGVTVVIAAGNGRQNACDYDPAHVTEAIVVGASDSLDARAIWTDTTGSNYGSCVDLFAPGTAVAVDLLPGGVLDIGSGTSFAAPMVAGVAALYLQQYPYAAPADVERAITRGATTNVLSNVGAGSPNRLLYSDVPVGPVLSVTGPASAMLGSYCTWYMDVWEGAPPFTYSWSGLFSGSDFSVSGEAYASGDLFASVTDARGRTARASKHFDLGPMDPGYTCYF